MEQQPKAVLDREILALGAVIGLELGSTIMPSMAVAFATLSRDAMPRATSAPNAVQRLAGAIGTALLAIVLQRSIEANLPALTDSIQSIAAVPPVELARVAPALADAFGTSFWVALGLVVTALVPALLLPIARHRPEVEAVEAAAEGRAA